MKNLTILLFVLSAFAIYGQSDKEKAFNNAMKAIQEMDSGNIDEAIDLLKESEKLDPDEINYPYEMAYAYYLDKEYKKAIKKLSGLKDHKNVMDKIYQMLGNCYDMAGDEKKAIEHYDKGIELFPNSGILYLERGNMEMKKEEFISALGYYETGIMVEPEFPSNYYWATRIYLNSTEEVWGMIYGEIFMNIERNTQRTLNISKMLYDTYDSQITYTSDSSFSVSFSQNATITLDDISDTSDIRLPFGVGVYEPVLIFSMIMEKDIDLASLNRIRTKFTTSYFKDGHNEKYPNVLFEFQKRVMDEGHMEAYNYWILNQGDEEEFTKWHEENEEKWTNFIEWFTENPMEVSDDHFFHSTQY